MIVVFIITAILASLGIPEAAQLWQWFMDNMIITILLLIFLA